MAHRIINVEPDSPAACGGFLPEDVLVRLNEEPVRDFIDYQALTADSTVRAELLRDGRTLTLTVRKEEYAPLGLEFESPMMSGLRMCCNHCLFCFVDQLPAHVRDTMRVKDDDWRMSLMMGNYVTLTNVSGPELDRIIARHASPLYISVHATNPQLRTQLLGTPRAAGLLEQLARLSDGGIQFHCQAVLCPGLNDGPALEETIATLTRIPGALSLALVPVGLTCHRNGLTALRKYSPDEARSVLRQAEVWRERLLRERGTRFVFPSDEFYLQAEAELPADAAYEDYAQIDDGVGLLRLLETEFTQAWETLPAEERRSTGGAHLAVACGISAANFLREMFAAHPVTGTAISVYPVENRFFGADVTVSGLVVGQDLIREMRHRDSACVLITECMLRAEGDRFLDDMTLEEACRQLGREIIPVGRRGDDLLDALLTQRDRFRGKAE